MADYAVDLKRSNTTDNVTFLSGGMGFGQTRFPAILCTPTDKDVTFYSFVLPINVLLMFGCPFLVIIFWVVHKQHGLFRENQSKSLFKISTAERKLLIVFCYYVLLAVISLSSFTTSTRNIPERTRTALSYFSCEQEGHDPEAPCSRAEMESKNNSVVGTLTFVVMGLFPVVNLVYAVNIQELKEYCRSKKKPVSSEIPSTISSSAASSTARRA